MFGLGWFKVADIEDGRYSLLLPHPVCVLVAKIPAVSPSPKVPRTNKGTILSEFTLLNNEFIGPPRV